MVNVKWWDDFCINGEHKLKQLFSERANHLRDSIGMVINQDARISLEAFDPILLV